MTDCGTRQGYRHHLKAGEETCRPCRDANNRYNGRSRRPHSAGIKATLLDVIETQDRWLTEENAVDLTLDLHPEFKVNSIRRTFRRIVTAGMLVSKPDPDCELGRRLLYRWPV